MIQLTPHMPIMVATEPVDFRCGIDGLAQLCRQRLEADPFSGTLFAFCNRSGTALKILVYDGQGFWLCQKRLSSGRFRHWPRTPKDATSHSTSLLAHELYLLLSNGNPLNTQAAPLWRSVRAAA